MGSKSSGAGAVLVSLIAVVAYGMATKGDDTSGSKRDKSPAASTKCVRPVPNNIATGSGWGDPRYRNGKLHHRHEGLDFPAPKNTPIYAVQAGKVSFVGRTNPEGFGTLVAVTITGGPYKGYAVYYGHPNPGSWTVKKGDTVDKGEKLAGVGNTGDSTGYHLHLEVRPDGYGTSRNINPESWLRKCGGL